MERNRASNAKPALTGDTFFDFCRGHEIRKTISIILLFLLVVSSAMYALSGNLLGVGLGLVQFGLWYYIARNNCAPFVYIFAPLIFMLFMLAGIASIATASA